MSENPENSNEEEVVGASPESMFEEEALLPKGIIVRPIVTEMKESYLSYAMSVIISRALPDVRDG